MKRLLLICALAVAPLGCGGAGGSSKPAQITAGTTVARTPEVFAIVGPTRITASQVAGLIAYGQARAQEEGEPFPPQGTAQFAAVQKKAIDALVTLAEYEQKAASVGIHFTPEAITERAKTIEQEGRNVDTPQVQSAKRLLARLGLARDALFTYATRKVVVTKADVHAYFAQNRTFYENFPAAKKTIHEQVMAVKRNNVGNAFFARLPSEFKVVYKS